MRRSILSMMLSFCICSPAGANELLKIGVIGPMSGSAAQWGIELARGAEIRADEINAAGGLHVGAQVYDIQIVQYDHKANAAETITVVNKLAFQDKVKYIVGNAIGSTTAAAQTITEPNKILFTFISYGKKALGAQLPLSFRTDLSDVEVVEPFYRWLSETRPLVKRVAFLNPNDQSGKDTGIQQNEAAKSHGMTVVADEYYERDATNFYPLITRVLASKPDFIDLGSSSPGSAGLLLKQLQEMGFVGAKGWMSGVNLESVVKISGPDAAEGTLSPWSTNFNGADTPAPVRDFYAKYLKKYGETTGSIALGNYLALDVVTQAIQAVGSLDTERVAEQLSTGKFNSVWGPVIAGGQNTYGTNRQFLRPITITEIHAGHAQDVGKTLPRDMMTTKN
jgi:branched-chain amino acid transport system substrate-binding protein